MSRVAQYDDVKGAASAARHLALHSRATREPRARTPAPHAVLIYSLVLSQNFSPGGLQIGIAQPLPSGRAAWSSTP